MSITIELQNQSPLRYPGGKTRACKKLDEILNGYFNMENYERLISPFFGGGSFEFYIQNKYKLPIKANDKFTPLYNFWSQAKINKEELCSELRKIKKIDKNDFTNYRDCILNLNNEPLEQATKYFVINRCSFSGATLSGGFSLESSKKRFTSSSIDRIEKLDLDYIDFYNEDFSDFIDDNYRLENFMFLDPPYYLKVSKLYGNSGDLHENFDHQLLFEKVREKLNWIITYNDCDYIRDLYKDFRIIEVDWSYGMNKSKKSSEIVIVSN